ncbi:MAG: hypothetical protein ACLTHF_05610 [Fusicatenibacter saccharivorans]
MRNLGYDREPQPRYFLASCYYTIESENSKEKRYHRFGFYGIL